MANVKNTATAETALPRSDGQGPTGVITDRFFELIGWATLKEQENPELRIKSLVIDEPIPFESYSMTYGRPMVKQGVTAGYEVADGGFYAMTAEKNANAIKEILNK